jgi:hypothetical protein
VQKAGRMQIFSLEADLIVGLEKKIAQIMLELENEHRQQDQIVWNHGAGIPVDFARSRGGSKQSVFV